MSDLVAFLNARLDEDEAAARAAIRKLDGEHWLGLGVWQIRSPHESMNRIVEGEDIVIYDEGGHDEHQAAHIARQDPARVLREVEAKRRILAAYEAFRDEGVQNGQVISHAANAAAVALRVALNDLAAVYADHPDYSAPSWA